VNGRVVAELGEHSVGLASGRDRAVDVVAVETRTAVPTARTRDFSIVIITTRCYLAKYLWSLMRTVK